MKGAPKEVFPLLCPVREYDWLAGWSCTMHYSSSGVAEKDAVFTTVEAPRMKTLWTTITYEPDSFIEYLIVSGRNAVMRLSISLDAADGGSTNLTCRMLFTSTSRLGRLILRQMLDKRRTELNHYLAKGRMTK